MNTALYFTKELIKIPSESSKESDIIDYINNYLKKLGKIYKFGNSLALKIEGNNCKKAFIFNGHIDTVPPCNLWTKHPFKPLELKGKLYGLGASDMKGGAGIMMYFAEYYWQHKPPIDLWFMFVEKEEIDGSGTKKVLDLLPDFNKTYPDGVEGIILEPTDSAYFGIGHKGNVFVNLNFKGQGGHGSVSLSQHTRATHKAAKLINDLDKIINNWQKMYSSATLGQPSINVTNLESLGSKALNTVPDIVKVTLDIRTTPEFGDDYFNILNNLCKKYDCSFDLPFGYNQHGLCPNNSKLLDIVKTKLKGSTKIFDGATDQLFFTIKNIPMLIYGPGNNNIMHQPDEYITINNINKSINLIAKLIKYYSYK